VELNTGAGYTLEMSDYPRLLFMLDCPEKNTQVCVKQLSPKRVMILIPPNCGSNSILKRVRQLLPKSIREIKVVNE
jgi:hypothetical protein